MAFQINSSFPCSWLAFKLWLKWRAEVEAYASAPLSFGNLAKTYLIYWKQINSYNENSFFYIVPFGLFLHSDNFVRWESQIKSFQNFILTSSFNSVSQNVRSKFFLPGHSRQIILTNFVLKLIKKCLLIVIKECLPSPPPNLF